ncbi:MAG: hypothetical protein ABJD07_14145 [Gemmatimonadaceae bacterium]
MIPSGLHRVLDFATVIAFAAAPLLFHLTGTAAILAYLLAGVHLVLTLLTRFVNGGNGVVPLAVHGMIELVVGIVLVVLPFVLGWSGIARGFFLAAGVVILAVWALSIYDARAGAPA